MALRAGAFFMLFLLLFSNASALSPDQKKLFEKNIRYFNLDECSTAPTAENNQDQAVADASTQQLAQQMLANKNITYWTNPPEGAAADWASRVPAGGNKTAIDTKDVVKALAQGDEAYTTAGNAPNKTAELNSNILRFILAAAKEGNVMVNALTDKTHTSTSNHYKGLAVDLDLNTDVPVSQLESIAATYGGKKNDESDHHHFDFLDKPARSETASSSEGKIKGPVFILGDSIMQGAYYGSGGLKKAFDDTGTKAIVDAQVSRSIENTPGQQGNAINGKRTTGLEAVEADKPYIKQAGTIVIELGTNIDGNPEVFQQSLNQLVTSIQNINKDAPVYIINLFSPAVKQLDQRNQAIEQVAQQHNAIVIDVSKQKIDTKDDIHPSNPEGYKTYTDLIMKGLSSQTATSPQQEAAASGCCPAGGGVTGSTTLVGSDNAEKIFNFFVGQGLEPYQAAAIMGNMNSESTLQSNVIEGGSHGDYPIRNIGFGLVQWTFADRQIPLEELAKKSGVKPSDLGIQLQYVMQELEGPYSSVYNAFKNSGNVKDATLIIETDYEVHAGAVQPQRTADAISFLAKYGSGAGGASSGSAESGSCTQDEGSSDTVSGDYSLPVDRSIYDKNPSWFTEPHHDYPAIDIPVPSGTKVYSMTGGKVIKAPAGSGCGNGVIIDAPDGAQFTYCHGSDGGTITGAKTGDTIKPGQLIMHSDNTGHSTGPHLHVEIEVGGTPHCPQKLFKSIADGSPIKPSDLPTSGCST